MASGWYVYAIVGRNAELPASLRGLDGAVVTSVSHRELAAIVSPIEQTALRPDAENVLRHEEVVEATRRCEPGLPVRFGTILPSTGALLQALDERHDVLVADLARLGDMVELGVAALRDVADEPERALSDSSTEISGLGTSYLRARMSVLQRQDALRASARQLESAMDGRLLAYADDCRHTYFPTRRLMLRSAYLVRPSRIEAFRQAFELLQREQHDARLLLSGPWPPYTFVSRADASSSGLLGSLRQLADRAD
jgi:hypothetical protein